MRNEIIEINEFTAIKVENKNDSLLWLDGSVTTIPHDLATKIMCTRAKAKNRFNYILLLGSHIFVWKANMWMQEK